MTLLFNVSYLPIRFQGSLGIPSVPQKPLGAFRWGWRKRCETNYLEITVRIQTAPAIFRYERFPTTPHPKAPKGQKGGLEPERTVRKF